MYARIINKETKRCDVGLGTDIEFYKSIGMTEMEVEQAYDSNWYVKGYAPTKPQSVKEENVRAIRNQYLATYVDPIQLVIRWNSLSTEDKQNYTDYRQYLLDYTNTESWWEKNPDDYPTWLSKR